MPQIEQLAATWGSQVFWLVLTFGIVFLVVGLGMVPKVQGTVDKRDQGIAADLAAADQARQAADATSALEARRGRASYTGERSIGSPDPGAVAVAVLAERIADDW